MSRVRLIFRWLDHTMLFLSVLTTAWILYQVLAHGQHGARAPAYFFLWITVPSFFI